MTYIPERGDFLRLSFDPQIGHEQMGNRPALVVSHEELSRFCSNRDILKSLTLSEPNPDLLWKMFLGR